MKNFFKHLAYIVNIILILGILTTAFNMLIKAGLVQNEITVNLFKDYVVIFGMAAYIIYFCPQTFKRHFSENFKFNDSILRTLCYAILIGMLMRILTNVLQVTPFFFGLEILEPGSNQVVMEAGTFDNFFSSTVLAPLGEEFIFRVIPFTILNYLCYKHGTFKLFKRKLNLYNLKSIECWVLILVMSTIFSWMHGPTFITFFLYFIPGVILNYMFVRFGYFAAVITHAVNNYLSFVWVYLIMEWLYNLSH